MDRLVGQYACKLCFCCQLLEHSLRDKDIPAGQSKGINRFIIQCNEVIVPIGLMANAGDSLADTVNVVSQTHIGNSAAHFLFNFRSILAPYFKILLYRNHHKAFFAGYGIDCTADAKAKGNV